MRSALQSTNLGVLRERGRGRERRERGRGRERRERGREGERGGREGEIDLD